MGTAIGLRRCETSLPAAGVFGAVFGDRGVKLLIYPRPQTAGVPMAFLFCNTRQMQLGPAHPPTIAEHKANIAQVLHQSAFSDVITNDAEVAGNRGTMRLSILHLPISDGRFYEQVMAAGEDRDATLGLVNEIFTAITF